jgi:hypothetical protein
MHSNKFFIKFRTFFIVHFQVSFTYHQVLILDFQQKFLLTWNIFRSLQTKVHFLPCNVFMLVKFLDLSDDFLHDKNFYFYSILEGFLELFILLMLMILSKIFEINDQHDKNKEKIMKYFYSILIYLARNFKVWFYNLKTRNTKFKATLIFFKKLWVGNSQ